MFRFPSGLRERIAAFAQDNCYDTVAIEDAGRWCIVKCADEQDAILIRLRF